MINGKTFYQILGVLEDAEDIVIRAAYKALAQKYHPDKWSGSIEEATQRMSEVNQAYAVLSDKGKRIDYDRTLNASEYVDPSGDTGDFTDSLESDWKEVLKYFPDLVQISRSLREISRSLEQTFKLVLIEKKLFNQRKEVAAELEKRYLERFFGINPEILKFARLCISQGDQAAAREINKAVSLLGSSVKPSIIIDRVIETHLPQLRTKEAKLAYEIVHLNSADVSTEMCESFLRAIGVVLEKHGILSFAYNIRYNGKTLYDVKEDKLLSYTKNLAKDYLASKT
jgi:hypothetical protein